MPVNTELVAAIQDTIDSAFDYKMDSIHTSIPCIVLAVRAGGSSQLVDIQPTINQKLPDGTIKERPPILGVPISFPVSNTAGMTYPIKVGDTGMAVFAMRNMDTWKAGNGRPSSPSNASKMSAGDAAFYPGIQPPGNAVNNPAKHVLTHSTEDTVMFANLGAVECEVRLKADGSIEINTSNQPVTINCSVASINASQEINLATPVMNVDSDVTNWTGNINLQGSIVQIGDWTQTGNYTAVGIQSFNSIIFSSHKHGTSPPPSN